MCVIPLLERKSSRSIQAKGEVQLKKKKKKEIKKRVLYHNQELIPFSNSIS